MIEDIKKLLETLKLRGMQDTIDRIMAQYQQEGQAPQWLILQLLREEYCYRQERAQDYRLKQAKIPWDWTIETFPFDRQPGVKAHQVRSLTKLEFMSRAENIILIGNPGTGKTGIAISILRQALLEGHRGRYYNAQNLIDELYASLADKTTSKLINKLTRYELLIIDELGYLTLTEEQANAFFKLLDQRYGKRSTIITTNLKYPQWYDLFKRKSLVDAMLDRLQHHCITIEIDGPSLRSTDKPESK